MKASFWFRCNDVNLRSGIAKTFSDGAARPSMPSVPPLEGRAMFPPSPSLHSPQCSIIPAIEAIAVTASRFRSASPREPRWCA
jgi:hypothetical protein